MAGLFAVYLPSRPQFVARVCRAVIPGTTSPTVVERVQLRSGNGNGIGYGYGYEVGMGSSSAYDMFIEFAPYMPGLPLQLQLHSRCRCAT